MTSRRAHQCRKDGCDSEATWQMFIKFVSRTPAGVFQPMTIKHWICVCDAHRRDAAEGFVSEQTLDNFARMLGRERLTMPHPRSIEIEFGRVNAA